MSSKPPTPAPGAQVLSLAEKRLLDAYGEAVKGSLASTDSAAEKILTAAFAIATAFAAVIGLVAPEDEPNPVVVAAPFLLFGAAAILAMFALLRGIKPASDATSDQMLEPVKQVLARKRQFATGSVVALALAVGVGAWTVAAVYGPQTSSETEVGTVVALVPETGADVITQTCPGRASSSVTGEIDLGTLDEDFLVIEVAAGGCQEAATTLRIPQSQIASVLSG